MHMPTLKREWTATDRDDLPDDGNRYEVIDGELFVTPAPAWRHQEAVVQLYRLLADYLGAERVGHVVVAPADVVFSPIRAVQPDLFVVPLARGRRPERFEDVGRLLLAAEIISPSSARADRVKKRVLYRDEGVAEYWMVDLDSRTVERSTPEDVRVDVLAERMTWAPEGAVHSLEIDLTDYFSRVLDR